MFIQKVQTKVDYYKPLIERKTGIGLGTVTVKDNSDWLYDTITASANRQTLEDAWAKGKLPTEKDYNFSFFIGSIRECIATIPLWFYNSYIGADLRAGDDIIYVPFYFMNRFADVDFRIRESRLDRGVVHELSHLLWCKISGDAIGYNLFHYDRWLFEGFAEYCSVKYFSEFYPEQTRINISLPKVYIAGRKIIEEIIEKYGEGILLEIPKIQKLPA